MFTTASRESLRQHLPAGCRELRPPEGANTVRWLLQFDARPVLVPEGLPASSRIQLVSLVVLQEEQFVVEVSTVGQLCGLLRIKADALVASPLFFAVPRAMLGESGPAVAGS